MSGVTITDDESFGLHAERHINNQPPQKKVKSNIKIEIRDIVSEMMDKDFQHIVMNDLFDTLICDGRHTDTFIDGTLKSRMITVIQKRCLDSFCFSEVKEEHAHQMMKLFFGRYISVAYFHTFYSRCMEPSQNVWILLCEKLESDAAENAIGLISNKVERRKAAMVCTDTYAHILCDFIVWRHGMTSKDITKGIIEGTIKGSITALRQWIQYDHHYMHWGKNGSYTQINVDRIVGLSRGRKCALLRTCVIICMEDPCLCLNSVLRAELLPLLNFPVGVTDICCEYVHLFVDSLCEDIDCFRWDTRPFYSKIGPKKKSINQS